MSDLPKLFSHSDSKSSAAMVTSVLMARIQIERLVFRSKRGAVAEFLFNKRLTCSAVVEANGYSRVHARHASMSTEEAAVAVVALQMALDWIAEETR